MGKKREEEGEEEGGREKSKLRSRRERIGEDGCISPRPIISRKNPNSKS